MATGGYRKLLKNFGVAGSLVSGRNTGLRALLKEILRDVGDLATHTHRYDGSDAGLAQTTGPQSTTAGTHTGGTAITFGSYTIS